MNYTYMVQCADGSLYTGWTNCLSKRLKAHNESKSGAKYTRTKRPVKLVYYEGYETKEGARGREYANKAADKERKAAAYRVLIEIKTINCSQQQKLPCR